MNENININENFNCSDSICNEYFCGFRSVLYKRLNNVIINDERISKAFSFIEKHVEIGNSFSLSELLIAAETLITGHEPDINAGNGIYLLSNLNVKKNRTLTKLISNSVNGVHSLFALRNGVSIDIDLIGGDLKNAESKRFAVISDKKMNKISKKLRNSGVQILRIGEMISTNKIIIRKSGMTVDSFDKATLYSVDNHCSVTIGSADYGAFLSGYNSVMSIELCNTVSDNNVIRFGLGDDLCSVFARVLGYFTAFSYLRNLPVKQVFTSDNNAVVAVPRPDIADGDYFYLLRVRSDIDGLPDKSHYAQLQYYLSEKKRMGIVKDILPVRNNIDNVLKRLCNENIDYITISEQVEYGFGVIVSVGRGESVNGIKLGYFKKI